MAAGDTKFEELTVPELKAVAEQFAVDLDGITKKADIVAEIKTLGVTWQMYADTLEPVEEDEPVELTALDVAPLAEDAAEPVEEEDEELIVVKMVRANFTYEIRGYRFTRQHPYALVKEEDADYLVEVDGGFRMASPREIREFYGA